MKKVVAKLRLKVPAGRASPTPAIASCLGPKGINLMKFCQACNELTASMGQSDVRVRVILYDDKNFDIKVRGRHSSDVIKEALQLQSGSSSAGKDFIKSVNMDQVREIAEKLLSSMNTRSIDSAMSMVRGKMFSMGIRVLES